MFTRDLTGTVPNRTGFCLHWTILEPVQNGTEIQIGAVKRQVQFWIRSGPVPERSGVNRRPIRSDFPTRSIWNRSRVNIA